MLYILDDNNQPREVDEMNLWDEWMCSHEEKVVIGNDCCEKRDIKISTVFLGVGSIKGGEFPQLFESVIYEEGEILEVRRYSDYSEARKNHIDLVKRFGAN